MEEKYKENFNFLNNNTPKWCLFSDILNKSPITLIYCIIYFVFVILILLCGLHFYKIQKNGHKNHQSTIIEPSGYKKVMFI